MTTTNEMRLDLQRDFGTIRAGKSNHRILPRLRNQLLYVLAIFAVTSFLLIFYFNHSASVYEIFDNYSRKNISKERYVTARKLSKYNDDKSTSETIAKNTNYFYSGESVNNFTDEGEIDRIPVFQFFWLVLFWHMCFAFIFYMLIFTSEFTKKYTIFFYYFFSLSL